MSLREDVLRARKGMAFEILERIEEEPKLLNDLIEIILSDKHPEAWRAAWILDWYVRTYEKESAQAYINEFIILLDKTENNSLRGRLLKLFQSLNLNVDNIGLLFDVSYRLFYNSNVPSFVTLYSMQILFLITRVEPELKNELIIILEDMIPHLSKSYIKKGAQKMLKKLYSEIK